MIATPANLLAMLKATALGWKQDNIAKEAKRIAGLGRELYDRINTLAGHTFDLGKSINRSAEYYNKMIGTMERQILSTARKLKDMDVIGDGARELNDLDPLEIDTRKFQAKEFVLGEIRISSNELLAESGE
jgi:DNA recombination protein RmuC